VALKSLDKSRKFIEKSARFFHSLEIPGQSPFILELRFLTIVNPLIKRHLAMRPQTMINGSAKS
jgi:hypothetical protein